MTDESLQNQSAFQKRRMKTIVGCILIPLAILVIVGYVIIEGLKYIDSFYFHSTSPDRAYRLILKFDEYPNENVLIYIQHIGHGRTKLIGQVTVMRDIYANIQCSDIQWRSEYVIFVLDGGEGSVPVVLSGTDYSVINDPEYKKLREDW